MRVIQRVRRASGLLEDICEHGIGHPNSEWLKSHPELAEGLGIHGCDGCCITEAVEALSEEDYPLEDDNKDGGDNSLDQEDV